MSFALGRRRFLALGVSVAGVAQVETEGGQNPLFENVSACQPPGRAM